MATGSNTTPLVAIVGETASGKSALALELAEQFGGEIIAADSRTVYKGMDIGTAKPTPAERVRVPHHLLDVVTPDQPFSVADFKRLAEAAIADIAARGKIPFLVGGTGLYIDAVLHDFTFRGKGDPALRARLTRLTTEELQQMLIDQDISLPKNERNPRHLVRAIETGGESVAKSALRPDALILGLQIEREALRQKVTRRVGAMVEQGLVDEVAALAGTYGWEAPALQAPGYKAFREYLLGNLTLEEAKAQFVHNDMQLAKRQRTWFRRNNSIHWISKREEAVDLLTTKLSK